MKGKLQKRRLLALLLSVAMVISMMPGLAFADEPAGNTDGTENPTEQTGNVAQIGETKYDTLQAAIEAATDGAEIKLLDDVEEKIGKENTDNGGKFFEIEKSITIDLSETTLTLLNDSSFWIRNARTLTIKNGALNATKLPNGTCSTFNIQAGSSMEVDNVVADTNGSFLYPQGDAAKVNVKDSEIFCGVYAVGTNAATADNYDVEITLNDSTFISKHGYNGTDNDSCPILVNIPCDFDMKNCTVEGSRQGVVVRGGTANISNCKIETTAKYESGINKYWNGDWGSGDEVPMAALVVGNRSAAYKYPATCKVVDSVITAPDSVKAIYAYEMNEEGRKVTLDLTGTETSVNGKFLRDKENPATVNVTAGTFTDPSVLNYITDKANISMGTDWTLEKPTTIAKESVTLDGKGNTLKYSGFKDSRGLKIWGNGTNLKNLTVDANKVNYGLAIHNGGEKATIDNVTLENVSVINPGKTGLDINGVKVLTLKNVNAAKSTGFNYVLDNVEGLTTAGTNLGEVSVHNKWGAIKNVNLSTANKVKVEDFSVFGEYTFDNNDTANKGNKEDWKIFEQAGDSPKLAANTITLGNNMYPTVVSKPVDSQLRAYAVEYNYKPPYVPPTEPEDKPEPPKVDEDGAVEVPVTKPDENGKVEADVPDAVVSDALDKIIADVEAGKKENIVVEIKVETDSKAEAVDVKVDAAAIDKIAKTENATLKVESNVGALELDNDVLKEISKNAGGEKVNISIGKPKVENMPAKQQEKIKEVAKEGMVFDLSITAGDKKISNLGGTATLSVDYDLPENEVAEGVRVYFIDDNGKAKLVDAYYDAKTKKIIMKTDHFSVYVVSYVDVPSKVSILKANNAAGKASLRWSRATNDPDGYRVYRSATKDGKYKPIAWVKNGKAKTYKEKAFKSNKTYYYKVRAYKKVNGKCVWGAYSPIKVVKF